MMVIIKIKESKDYAYWKYQYKVLNITNLFESKFIQEEK